MNRSLSKTLEHWDFEIRGGRAEEVRKALIDFDIKSIPRPQAATFANLARRVNLPERSIQVLYPIVRSKNRSEASGIEVAEYAAALTLVGSSREAYGLLGKVDVKTVPEALLYRAFALFARWDYKLAIEPLLEYINRPDILDYDRLVGKVNLASVLVTERLYKDAEELLNAICEEARSAGHQLLLGNALQMLAESNIDRKNWNIADKLLYDAEAAMKTPSSLYELFIKKHRCFLKLRSLGTSDERLAELRKVKFLAKEMRHWETIRDCDRFQSLITQDRQLFLQVFFGTPFASFRKHMLDDFGTEIEIPSFYFWGKLPMGPNLQTPELDVTSGTVTHPVQSGMVQKSKSALETGSPVHRLLWILCSDFYAPFRVRLIFADIFPGEFFDPGTSEKRVVATTEELGAWFKTSRLPITLDRTDNAFSLSFTSDVAIKVKRRDQPTG